MVVKLGDIVSSLVETAPPVELKEVSNDLNSILEGNSKLTVIDSLETFVNSKGGVFSDKFIASTYNKVDHSSKYVDYVNKKAFNIDVTSSKAIDFEDFDPQIPYPEYFDNLVEKLSKYGEDHYPSKYAFTIIPKEEKTHIILVGQRLNLSNFYSGRWYSHYVIHDETLSEMVEIDIHYYEEGNVRLNFKDEKQVKLTLLDASAIVNAIDKFENDTTKEIVENFNELNHKQFKSLRRLLPVTRSKVNWGKAIGNYRLGSDVVNNK